MIFLSLSNCYGEDRSGALILKELKTKIPRCQVLGAPLISQGEEYLKRGIKVITKAPLPPSGGFPTRSFKYLILDILNSRLIPIRYFYTLKKWREKTISAIVVGDVFLLILGTLALKKRLFFLAPCKSDHQNPHYAIERFIVKRLASVIFTHDEYTASNLCKQGINALFLGNPMMDELIQNSEFRIQNSEFKIGILPGSRDESYNNFKKILKVVELLSTHPTSHIPQPITFLVAVSERLDVEKLASVVQKDPRQDGYATTGNTGFQPVKRKEILFFKNTFASVIKSSDIIIGLAGTANEQTAGLGKPIVSFAGTGPQTTKKRMKNQERLLGGALKFVEDFPNGVVREINLVLDNPEIREQRGRIGIDRMGPPGGAKRIAEYILEVKGLPTS